MATDDDRNERVILPSLETPTLTKDRKSVV